MAKASTTQKAAKKMVSTKAVTVKTTPDKIKKEPAIKYTDKSAGQPQLTPIFEAIKKMMLPYGKKSFKIMGGEGGMLSLISQKPVVIEGRKKEELWFAGILVQKGYVGFYYMPVYAFPELKKVLKPALLNCLKGKSCFHIKKQDPVIMGQIKESLKIGYAMFKEKGWI